MSLLSQQPGQGPCWLHAVLLNPTRRKLPGRVAEGAEFLLPQTPRKGMAFPAASSRQRGRSSPSSSLPALSEQASNTHLFWAPRAGCACQATAICHAKSVTFPSHLDSFPLPAPQTSKEGCTQELSVAAPHNHSSAPTARRGAEAFGTPNTNP